MNYNQLIKYAQDLAKCARIASDKETRSVLWDLAKSNLMKAIQLNKGQQIEPSKKQP